MILIARPYAIQHRLFRMEPISRLSRKQVYLINRVYWERKNPLPVLICYSEAGSAMISSRVFPRLSKKRSRTIR